MKKKVLVTRKLLRSNEERASKLWDAKLNLNDEVYSQQKIIELSQGCDGILSSLTEKIDEKVINSLPPSVKTSGVFVTTIFFFFAASISIFPKPTAKLEIILMVGDKLLMTFSSIFSVKELKIPSHP